MVDNHIAEPPELTGTVDERVRALAALEAAAPLPADWLLRELKSSLRAWAEAATRDDIEIEAHVDY